MVGKWNWIIENGKPGHSAVIDVNLWFGKATLDACVLALASGIRIDENSSPKSIGAGAFDYNFGALDDTDNPFTKSYMNLMYVHTCPSSAI